MTRWTVYDSNTGRHIHRIARNQDDVVEDPTPGADALSSALADEVDAVAILPGNAPSTATVVSIRRSSRRARFEPTGFLGVHDQIVLDPPQPRKKWWQRIFD